MKRNSISRRGLRSFISKDIYLNLDVNRQWKTFMDQKNPHAPGSSKRNSVLYNKRINISNSDLVRINS